MSQRKSLTSVHFDNFTRCKTPRGSGDSSVIKAPDWWLKCRGRIRVPAGAAGEFSSPESTFRASEFYFGVSVFQTRVTATVRKRSRSFCQNSVSAGSGLQLNTHASYVFGFALNVVTWCMVVWCTQNVLRDGSSLTWHQPCRPNNQTAL